MSVAAARRAHAIYYADFTQRQWERLTGEGREAANRAVAKFGLTTPRC